MTAAVLSALLMAAVAGASVHGHSAGVRQVYAEAAALAARARQTGGEA